MDPQGMFEEELARETLFENQSKLSPDFVPEELVHREGEPEGLVRFLEPVLRGDPGRTVLVVGSVGTGKTALTSKLGRRLEGVSEGEDVDLTHVQVNCRREGSPGMVLRGLAADLPVEIPKPEFNVRTAVEGMINCLRREGVHLVAVLDDLGYFVRRNGSGFLGSLVRVAEESDNSRWLSIVATSHSINFLNSVGVRVRDAFSRKLVELEKYSARQLSDILRQRAKIAFKPDSVEDGAVELISKVSARQGDARFALELLYHAGKSASREGADRVMLNHA